MVMGDFHSIKVTKGVKTLEIDNPTNYPLIEMGALGAVFKLSEDRCVKIYSDRLQAKMEAKALNAGKHLPFFPKVFRTGSDYIVMEYINAPTLQEYLNNCTYIPESISRKLLDILKEFKKANFKMIDVSLRHILVLENEELKVIDHVNAFKLIHPVPLILLRDLKMILLKDSFLAHVKNLEPETLEAWENYFNENRLDYKNIPVISGGSGEGVNVESAVTQTLIGKGHQGAVFRVSEDKCVKVYGKPKHAKQEQAVLLSSQNLSFIPKVYETGSNYVLMEYLSGPDLNTYLKKQSALSEDITRRLLDIVTTMKKSGFKQIDAPLRQIIVTNRGFKLVDHVYSFSRKKERPLELFQNLHERGFLDSFLEQVKAIDPNTHAEWTKTPIPLTNEETAKNEGKKRKRDYNRKKDHDRKKNHSRSKDHNRKKGTDRRK
jgi:RIO-like serine/threonine protein kinase